MSEKHCDSDLDLFSDMQLYVFFVPFLARYGNGEKWGRISAVLQGWEIFQVRQSLSKSERDIVAGRSQCRTDLFLHSNLSIW